MQISEIDTLVHLLAKLPALGPRSARRAVLYLLKKKDSTMAPLITAMQDVYDNVQACPVCGNMDTQVPCAICGDEKRDKTTLCVVQDVSDLWALERSNAFKGVYHVLGGVLSALRPAAFKKSYWLCRQRLTDKQRRTTLPKVWKDCRLKYPDCLTVSRSVENWIIWTTERFKRPLKPAEVYNLFQSQQMVG